MEKNQVLDKLKNKELTSKQAYKALYQEEKIRKPKKAHFVKMKVVVPDEKGVSLFLAILFLLPVPMFIIKLILKRRKNIKLADTEFEVEELIDLISVKGVKLDVRTHDRVRVLIKTY